jgi:hypothetical protein
MGGEVEDVLVLTHGGSRLLVNLEAGCGLHETMIGG